MTIENAIKILEIAKAEIEWTAPLEYQEAFDMAIDALQNIPTQMSGTSDLIRRQDALNCFHCWIDKHGDVQEPDDMAEYRAIENLPSVQIGKRSEE